LREFWACHWGVEVEILQINGAVACTFCGVDAVEVNFDRDHVNGGCTAVPGVGDAIAVNGEASAIGVGLLRAIVDAHASICDIFLSIDWDIVSSDEDYCVVACANARDALGQATKFDCVGLAPEFFVLGVDEKVVHFLRVPVLVLRTAWKISQVKLST
jgi:hypothetical protein